MVSRPKKDEEIREVAAKKMDRRLLQEEQVTKRVYRWVNGELIYMRLFRRPETGPASRREGRDGEGWMACGHQADAWVGDGGEHGRRDKSGSIETKVAFHF
jgi:hypothetical protein